MPKFISNPLLKAIHWVIVVNFMLQVGYGAYMVFFALKDEKAGPLYDRAKNMPPEQMAARRGYAVETWVAISGLALYLAVTEFLPRALKGGKRPFYSLF